jgi:DNA-binding IclR family transcriptional regulator
LFGRTFYDHAEEVGPMIAADGVQPAKEQRVESVERALTLLEVFGGSGEPLSLNDLAKATGFYRSTILRLAASLQRMGYLNRDTDGRYRLGPTLWRLGSLYQRSFHLADYVRPVLDDITAATGETAAFYVREDDRRVCLYRAHGRHVVRHHLDEGASLPLDRGAGGQVLTAFTGGDGERARQVRAHGFHFSDGERDPETAAVAVPVFGMGGRFVGALAAIGTRTRLADGQHLQIRDILTDHATRLGTELGSR